MPRFVLALSALLAVAVCAAAPVPKAVKKKADADSIVGEWADSPGAQSVWLFRDDGTAGVGDPANPACKAIYKIDPTQTPKHLDWSQDGGRSWHLGVYEVDGDSLKISFGGGGNGVRPTTVDRNNTFQFVGVTRRVKDK